MKRRPGTTLLAVLALLALVAAGCSSGDGDSAVAAAQPTEVPVDDGPTDDGAGGGGDDGSGGGEDSGDEGGETGDEGEGAQSADADLPEPIEVEPVSVAMVSDGELQAGGWYASMEDGRLFLEDRLRGVTVDMFENVQPGEEAQTTFGDLADQGYPVIISIGAFDPDLAIVAPTRPDTVFLQSCDATVLDNMSQYCPATEQARYIDGVLAGSVSQSGSIGYVMAFDQPFSRLSLNAFTLGARSVNPAATVEVRVTNNWYDPDIERQAAADLVGAGVDVLTYDVSSTAVPEVAAASNVAFVGYRFGDARFPAGEAWAGGSLYRWGPMFVEQVGAVLDQSWESGYTYGGYESGYLSYDLPEGMSEEARGAVEAAIVNLTRSLIDPFEGPIEDVTGAVVVPAGQSPDLGSCCEWLAAGVIMPEATGG